MGANANRQAVQKLRDCARSSGAFANFELLGSYDDFSQVVSIEYLDKDDFMGLLERFRLARGSRGMQKAELQANYEAIAKFYSTCAHELTHWLDHSSTLWGQKQLVLIYNAINAWTNQDEQEFYRIVAANSERQRARLATYYTEEYDTSTQDTRTATWRYEYGSGLEFGIDGKPRPDRPFVFTTFSNSGGQRIIRVPFSMFALTEATATYAELKVKSQSLAFLDSDTRLVEQARLEQEFQRDLYDPKLAIYSTATHCLANSIQLQDSFIAYEYSSALSTLCLNLPRSLYDHLLLPESFSDWGSRTQALRELADPGFAFFAIASQAPRYEDEMPVEQWLQGAAKSAGLPELATIEALALSHIQQVRNEQIEGSYSDQAESLLSIGRDNFTQRGVWGRGALCMEGMYSPSIRLPPVVLGDGHVTPVNPSNTCINPQSIEKWIDAIVGIESSANKFVRACRY
jgi:hypothetical protein